MSAQDDAADAGGSWPLMDLALPAELFPDEHLRIALFEYLPLAYHCAAATIRQGIKAHLKRTAPGTPRLTGSDQQARDRRMVSLFGNVPAARDRAGEIIFLAAESFNKRGRGGTRERILPQTESFADLLWRSYRKAPEMAELYQWLLDANDGRPDRGERVFVTSDTFSAAVASGTCPVALDNEWLARSVVLFASLLPDDGCASLLSAAAGLGCAPLASAYPVGGGTALPSPQDGVTLVPRTEPVASRQPLRPRLAAAEVVPRGENDASPDVVRYVEEFRASDVRRIATRLAAEQALGQDIAVILDGPDEAWQAVLGAVAKSRSAASAWQDAERRGHAHLASLYDALDQLIGGGLATVPVTAPTGTVALAADLLAADRLSNTLRLLQPSRRVVRQWRATVVGLTPIEACDALVRAAEQDVARHRAETDFREQVAAYAAGQSTAEVTAFLAGLDAGGLAAVLPALLDAPWVVAGSIILRSLVDKGEPELSASLSRVLDAPRAIRRALLHFVDPASSIFDSFPPFRRVVALERLTDIMTFGPLAQIGDPSSGLSEAGLVGRSVHELVETIAGNLDIFSAGIDVVRMLRPRADQATAAQRLADHIHAPATMSGNFRRLRETAREQALLPILDKPGLNARRASALLGELVSGNVMESVLATFAAERPLDRLESRHEEQLARYLHQAELLLADYLTEATTQPDARRKTLGENLRAIRARLRDHGEPGTIEWLEAEVGTVLDGADQDVDHRTLVGEATPVIERAWLEADQDWAEDLIDLPEFHGATPPTTLEVAASVLHWKGTGMPPSKRDIVDYLAERHAFRDALHLARDIGDTVAQSVVTVAAKPAIDALETRARSLAHQPNSASVEFDQEGFASALDSLNVDAASDLLDRWQLALLEQEEARAVDPMEPEADERRQRILDRLGLAGVEAVDDRMSLTELEAAWKDILFTRSAEREHFVEIARALEPVGTVLPKLAPRISAFMEQSYDPSFWLESTVAADFAILVSEAIQRIAAWIESSPNFRSEEQTALARLSVWYLDFLTERALSLHSQDDPEVVQSGFDRLLEVADTIIRAQRPSDCLGQLSEGGELEAGPGTHATLDDYASAAVPMDTSDEPDPPSEPVSATEDATVLPDGLVEVLQSQDWQGALDICENAASEAGSFQSARLSAIARAIDPLRDLDAIPVAEVADMFPASAAWLSNPIDGAPRIGESKRIVLAFQLLSGAIATDSEQAMPRKPSAGGNWEILVERSLPFRRMLTSGLPSRTGRVLEALVTGSLGLAVADKLWDAASKTGEPQTYRVPLLNLLNDHGAHEVIIKLAQRHETTIAPRLAQLFELRAVALNRPDLLPVSQSLAEHLAGQAKSGPFRTFVKNLPSASQSGRPTLKVSFDGTIQLRPPADSARIFDLPIVVTPEGLVPAKLFARLFAEDDVSFADESRYRALSDTPIYFATDFAVSLRFGLSWFGPERGKRDGVRIRIEAKTITDELIAEDAVCTVRPMDRGGTSSRILNTDTLLELYPGVANTPVVDDAFIGRFDEKESLHQVLVTAKNPSPVLLTGMRRVGKTSLLYAFHKRFSHVAGASAISIYQTLAERRVELSSLDHSVASVFFRTIQHALVRPNLPADDRNHALCARIRQHFHGEWKEARRAIQDCYDEESLSGSLIALVERLREWTGSQARFVFLIDEAEALVAAYQMGGRKRIELEQLLQSLREVSQTTASIGILLSGSNHINVFAREYKNAFFGSSQSIELEGFDDVTTASKIVAPRGIEAFVQFDSGAVEYAWSLCAGIPQFLWQVGATTALQVKSGPAGRSDIRAAVATLVGPDKARLPFKAYEMLEPIDSMLSLETPRERDLLWMLLYRVGQASSLALEDAALPFVIDQALVAADDRLSWKRRLATLVDLKVLRMDTSTSVRFRVPLFAEGFRAPKNWQEFNIRQQQVAI